MKTKRIISLSGIKASLAILFCIMAGNASSQLYGEYAYGIPNYILSSGSTGVNYPASPGVVLGGHRLNSTVSHLTIIRTNAGGQLPGTGAWEFQKEYQIMYNPTSCGAAGTPANTCYGISVIETNPTGASPGLKYVVAGGFDGGVFYAELSSTGNVLNTWYSALPNQGLVGKPVLCESSTNPGQFYVAGYQGGQLYAFKYIAGAAGPAVARFYKAGYCNPRAIIMSPFGNKDITIVGEAATPTAAWDGFFLQLNNATLAPTIYRNYNLNNNDQTFNSIDIANSNVAGGPGFIIGGFAPGSWMLKVNPTGLLGGGNWSKLISCSGAAVTSRVVGVVERVNTTGQYQYYGVLHASNDVVAVRLDAFGNSTALDQYPFGFFGNNPVAVALSKINTPGFPDEGLQIYAADRVAPANIYFAQACFSGQSGCNVVQNLNAVTNLNPTITNPVIAINSNMTGCYNSGFLLTPNSPAVSVNPCSASAPFSGPAAVGGSNARPAAATGLTNLTVDNGSLGVYPNPATNRISVTFNAGIGDNVKIELFDYLGRLITSVPVIVTSESQTEDINLGSLNIESGIYVVSANINGSTSTQKIVYTKD